MEDDHAHGCAGVSVGGRSTFEDTHSTMFGEQEQEKKGPKLLLELGPRVVLAISRQLDSTLQGSHSGVHTATITIRSEPIELALFTTSTCAAVATPAAPIPA